MYKTITVNIIWFVFHIAVSILLLYNIIFNTLVSEYLALNIFLIVSNSFFAIIIGIWLKNRYK